ncbi:HNH endonuclease [Providencia rettgeri]|nr:HNH endonuclease [Providencia rettgeri]
MIKLTPYSKSSLEFLNDVLNSKKDRGYKDRVERIKPELIPCYTRYDQLFSNKDLNSIVTPHGFNEIDSNDLLKLYKYSLKAFINLKNAILTLPDERSIDTCQYCTLNTVNTLDHIIPKDDFPEYSIHPKNLFPVCSQCNSKKQKKWLDSSNDYNFLNLYYHDLPQEQYLFANVDFSNGNFKVEFFLRNDNRINQTLFGVIERHYENLGLLERFKLKSNEIISSFETTIINNIDCFEVDLNRALSVALRKVNMDKAIFGYNHWELILTLELINGNAFREYCNTKGYN